MKYYKSYEQFNESISSNKLNKAKRNIASAKVQHSSTNVQKYIKRALINLSNTNLKKLSRDEISKFKTLFNELDNAIPDNMREAILSNDRVNKLYNKVKTIADKIPGKSKQMKTDVKSDDLNIEFKPALKITPFKEIILGKIKSKVNKYDSIISKAIFPILNVKDREFLNEHIKYFILKVKLVQAVLKYGEINGNVINKDIIIDGDYGDNTAEAVTQLQKTLKLKKIDGITGGETWTAILQYLGIKKSITVLESCKYLNEVYNLDVKCEEDEKEEVKEKPVGKTPVMSIPDIDKEDEYKPEIDKVKSGNSVIVDIPEIKEIMINIDNNKNIKNIDEIAIFIKFLEENYFNKDLTNSDEDVIYKEWMKILNTQTLNKDNFKYLYESYRKILHKEKNDNKDIFNDINQTFSALIPRTIDSWLLHKIKNPDFKFSGEGESEQGAEIVYKLYNILKSDNKLKPYLIRIKNVWQSLKSIKTEAPKKDVVKESPETIKKQQLLSLNNLTNFLIKKQLGVKSAKNIGDDVYNEFKKQFTTNNINKNNIVNLLNKYKTDVKGDSILKMILDIARTYGKGNYIKYISNAIYNIQKSEKLNWNSFSKKFAPYQGAFIIYNMYNLLDKNSELAKTLAKTMPGLEKKSVDVNK